MEKGDSNFIFDYLQNATAFVTNQNTTKQMLWCLEKLSKIKASVQYFTHQGCCLPLQPLCFEKPLGILLSL